MAVDLTKLIDIDLLAYFKSKMDLLLTSKVDKQTGKGLSSNDYTSSEKTKLANIESGSQVNVLEGIQRNGATVSLTNKIANIAVPTKTSDITNDSGFVTSSDIVGKAPIASPNFSGTPKAPTASAGTNTDQIATTAFVNTAISGKANSSDVYTKTEIDGKLVGAMNYKGTKSAVDQLPNTGNSKGDVWHVTEDGGEYARRHRGPPEYELSR